MNPAVYYQSSNLFYTHVDSLERCSDLEAMADVCEQVFAERGYPAFKYAWIPPGFQGQENEVLFISRPGMQVEHMGAKWFCENDPGMRYCCSHVRPVVRDSGLVDRFLDGCRDTEGEVQGFWEKALTMRVENLITVPIRGVAGSVGMLSLVSLDQRLVSFPFLEAWAHYMQNKVEALHAHTQVSEALSPREIEVVRWTMLGKTAMEIAMIMTISENTVHFHLKNIKRKLNVANKYHMVAKALTLGILTP